MECDAVADLAAAASGIVASLVVAGTPCLAGIDGAGRARWRSVVAGPALLLTAGRFVFAAVDDGIMAIDPADGRLAAAWQIDPPEGGWSPALTLAIGDDLLVATARGLARLQASDPAPRWMPLPVQAAESGAMQHLVYAPPHIAAVSRDILLLMSERGASIWTQRLPTDSRLAGDRPLVLDARRVWVGLVQEADTGVRQLHGHRLADGALACATQIPDLAMYCPARIVDGVLVLDTRDGLAGFEIDNGLRRRWSVAAALAMGTGVVRDGHLLVATRSGELLRIAFADGRQETLLRLPRKQVWVPPAPDLAPGLHSESTGSIAHLALLPGGVAFSVTWPSGRASIQCRPLR